MRPGRRGGDVKWARNSVAVIAVMLLITWLVSSLFLGIVYERGRSGIAVDGRGFVYNDSRTFNQWPATTTIESTPVFGFRFNLPAYVDDPRVLAIILPHWLANLMAWTALFLLWRRRRKHPKECCQTCGYNLTGNVSGRCPECDTAASVLQSR